MTFQKAVIFTLRKICQCLLLSTFPLVHFTKPTLAISSSAHITAIKEKNYNCSQCFVVQQIDYVRKYCSKGTVPTLQLYTLCQNGDELCSLLFQLTDRNIGSSRDTSFEQLIMTETNGRGVDLVLNSLSKEKLQASVRCLAPRGRFLEIGRFDLANNSLLGRPYFMSSLTSFLSCNLVFLWFAFVHFIVAVTANVINIQTN
jgi:hypothetical protein